MPTGTRSTTRDVHPMLDNPDCLFHHSRPTLQKVDELNDVLDGGLDDQQASTSCGASNLRPCTHPSASRHIAASSRVARPSHTAHTRQKARHDDKRAQHN